MNPWGDFNDAAVLPDEEDAPPAAPCAVEVEPAAIATFVDVVFGYCEGIHDCTTSQNITVRSATFEIKPARTNAQSSSGSRRLP